MSTRHAVAGKTVLITGAARGIGAATATELARRGARLALVGLEPDLLARNASALGEGHLWREADVTDQASLDTAVEATVAELGGIDVVIANAGIANMGTVRTASPAEFARTIDINLTGAYRTVYSATPHLIDRRGYVLIVASVASFVPLPGGGAYSASKAGVEALAGSLRAELAGYGVDVGSIHPSWIDTDLVRGAEAALPSFARMRAGLPWPANSTTSVETCALALADAVERRALRTYVPRATAVLSAVRPLVHSAVVARLTARRVGGDLRRLDAENREHGAVWH